MSITEKKTRSANSIYLSLAAVYALIYMNNGVYAAFIPVYLNDIGRSEAQIGVLMSLGSLLGLVTNFVWGEIGDRAKNKSNVLRAVLLGAMGACLLHPLFRSFGYMIVVMGAYFFFQAAVTPLSDSIALPTLEGIGRRFGPIRMCGTIGYALIAAVAGYFLSARPALMFPMSGVILLSAALLSLTLLPVRGAPRQKRTLAVIGLMRVPALPLLLAFSMVAQSMMGFYYSFFSIYLRQMGAGTSLIGWSTFLSAAGEVPLLLFADKLIDRVRPGPLLCVSGLAISLRMLLNALLQSPQALLPVQLLHCLCMILMAVTMAKYIHWAVPEDMRTSGQTLYWVTTGAGRMLGSMGGGALIAVMGGIRQMFFLGSALAFAATAVFVCALLYIKRRRPEQANGII